LRGRTILRNRKLERLLRLLEGPDPTPRQSWQAKRDLVLVVVHRAGVSQRELSRVFDLSKSRVSEIIALAQRVQLCEGPGQSPSRRGKTV
jgi:repressor of nif and glnA expression